MRKISIRRKRHRGVWGYADPVAYRIWLDPALGVDGGKDLLEIAVHETAHVCLPHHSEAVIDALGKQCADVLWRLGFRLQEDD